MVEMMDMIAVAVMVALKVVEMVEVLELLMAEEMVEMWGSSMAYYSVVGSVYQMVAGMVGITVI
jgi:hypothetical protein